MLIAMTAHPLISIIIATLNCADTLQQCLNSLARQTYLRVELIVIDGGSTDGTIEIARANAHAISCWESEKDRGIYHAWNKGVSHAQGEWLYFLGADDRLWSDGVLEKAAPYLCDAFPKFRVVYGKVAVTNNTGEILRIDGRPWEHCRADFRWQMTIPHQGVFQHRKLFEDQSFDESFRVAGDYEFLLRELKDRDALFVDMIIAGMRFGGLSNSPEYMPLSVEELARAQRKNNVPTGSIQWQWLRIKVLARSGLIRVFGERSTYYLTDAYRLITGKPPMWTR